MSLGQRIKEVLGLNDVYLPPKMYLANDSLVFFDVPAPTSATNVSALQNRPAEILWSRFYTWGLGRFNHVVEDGKIHYFTTEEFDGDISVLAVTTPCIVIATYVTDSQDNIVASGLYHALSLPPSETFRNRMTLLIDSIDHIIDGKFYKSQSFRIILP